MLMADDLREIEEAVARIDLHGERLPPPVGVARSGECIAHQSKPLRPPRRTFVLRPDPQFSATQMADAGRGTAAGINCSGVVRTSQHTKLRTCGLRGTCRRTEVVLGEGSAGSRFQVFLESNRVSFGRKLNRYDERPRAVISGVAARTVVVPLQPAVHVVCDSNVMP